MGYKFNPFSGNLDVVNEGAAGPEGPQGDPGSQIYTGAGIPSIGLGIDGDFYLNNNNGDYYKKISGTWDFQGALTTPVEPISPVFTYNVDNTLDNITYSDGSTKDFTYTDGKLTELVYVIFGGSTHTKTFNYIGDLLTSIDEIIT